MSHNERCKECKIRVRELLEKIYGTVIVNYRISLPTRPEDFRDHPHYSALNEIYSALQMHRGFTEFVRASYLDVDFFVPDPGFIVEFDESQHFTEPRKLTFAHYPSDVTTGFSREAWMKHCDEIRAYDNDPPFRDEQRAWYDTLRDFIPENKGFRPTVRLYAREMEWCRMDINNPEDIAKFKILLGEVGAHEVQNQGSESGYRFKEQDWIATVILKSNLEIAHEKDAENTPIRLSEMDLIIRSSLKKTSGDGVILFPGGWVHTQFKRAETIYPEIEQHVKDILIRTDRNIKVCIGIDGYFDRPVSDDPFDQDQMAITIDKTGIIAICRKFYPTDETERNSIILAENCYDGEQGKPRVFELNGVRYFPFLCHDVYGPFHEPDLRQNPGVDIGLNLIHRFRPRGSKLSREDYFPKNGWSEASYQWKIPIFGTSIFFRRSIPSDWPSGVMWAGGNLWSKRNYPDISLSPDLPIITIPLTEGSAEVRIFTDIAGKIDSMKQRSVSENNYENNTSPQQKSIPQIPVREKTFSRIAVLVLYEKLRKKLNPLFGKSVYDQKTKYTYRGINKIEYSGKTQLDMIALFKPSNNKSDGVKVRIYPFVLASHIGETDLNRILNGLPEHFLPKKERGNSHPGAIFYEGCFANEGEIEKFLQSIASE